MSASNGPRSGHDPDQLQHHALDEGVWVHVPEPSPKLANSIEVGTPVPVAVLDALRTPSDRVQRTVVAGWTTWTLRPVGFRIGPAVVDADHLVVAVAPGVVITAGQLPNATAQRIATPHAAHGATALPSGHMFAAMVVGDLIDDVGQVVERLDDEVEDIETAVFAPGRPSVAERIYRLKREVQTVRRSIGPLPELLTTDGVDRAARSGADTEATAAASLPTRARRLVERLSHVDELLDSVLTAHQARVAIQQNDDMRRISAWVAIVAAPTAMASIYGMNFRFMPELDWRFGYPLALGVMVVVCGGLYRLFRRSGWLWLPFPNDRRDPTREQAGDGRATQGGPTRVRAGLPARGQRPDVPRALARALPTSLRDALGNAIDVVGLATIAASTDIVGMALWRERLFALLHRSASSVLRYSPSTLGSHRQRRSSRGWQRNRGQDPPVA
jgi:magnesium transporter